MRRWAIITAVSLLLLVVLVAAAVYLGGVEEDDELSGLADFLEPVAGPLGRVARTLNPMTAARRQAVADSLQAHVPADCPDRAGLIGSCLAVYRNESGYDPSIFNFYDDAGKLRRGHGYDDPNFYRCHAAGIAQHVKKFWAERGLTAENVLDGDANVAAAVQSINLPAWRKIMDGIPSADLHTRAAVLYMGHGRGPATVPTAVATIAAGGTWDDVSAAVTAKWGTGGLRFPHMWTVAADAPGLAESYG